MSQPPVHQSREDYIAAVDHVIRERRTLKVMRDPSDCQELSPDVAADLYAAIRDSLEVAGWAPFHKAVHKETHLVQGPPSVVPWRFYVLEKPTCCRLLARLRSLSQAQTEGKWARAWASKIPRILAGSGAVVLATWLPDPSATDGAPELTENNQEHIAAASAAVQNLLLAAEARGLRTYWATGGVLKDAEVFGWLGIPTNQILLGAVFLAPTELPHDMLETGSWREKRDGPANWSVWIDPGQLDPSTAVA